MTGIALSKAKLGGPRAEMVEALTRIWERVLQRVPIGPEDNFFDLPGTDAQADLIFKAIADSMHRRLPAATICYASTIRALASLLEGPSLPSFSPIVPLKNGKGPPIFIFPGVGGRASFYDLAKHIRTDNPVYGLQAKGVDGRGQPLARVEEMAEYYLDAMRELRSPDFYLLVGYSFGGLVALEIAQSLLSKGKRVALLAMIDTYPHPRYIPFAQRLLLNARLVKNRSFRGAFSRVFGAIKNRLSKVSSNAQPPTPISPRLALSETMPWVKQKDFQALESYQPQFYKGKIKFIRPEENPYLPVHPAAVWKNFAAQFELDTVPGDHLGMIGTHFDRLGALLTTYVTDATEQMQGSSLYAVERTRTPDR
jgi:thioesterase domain-containing protein